MNTAPVVQPSGIIDLHCHVAGIGAGGSGCFVSDKLRRNWRYGIYLRAFGLTQADLERGGDALAVRRVADGVAAARSVDGAVVLALDGVVNGRGDLDREATEVYLPTDYLAGEVAKYANLFLGASVNPYRCDALERLERAKEQDAVLLKWLPSIQHIDPADQRIIPFYRRLAALDLPLLVHTGYERSFSRARHDVADPARLRLPLEQGVRVIAAHVATTGKSEGQDNMERLLEMMPRHPNLFADISSLTQLNKLVFFPRLLRRPEVFDRLLYGTDFPLINTALVSPWYFPGRLSWAQMRDLSRMENPWDRDVALKEALGLRREILTRPARFLGISPASALGGGAGAKGP